MASPKVQRVYQAGPGRYGRDHSQERPRIHEINKIADGQMPDSAITESETPNPA
jgi:hypothetical protein